MDNLGSHRSSAVRQALRAAGAKLFFLPKYSPDLNPIEMLFAKLKHGLRKAAKRTEQAIYDAVVDLLPTVASTECANYFARAGYART
jgi:transposase